MLRGLDDLNPVFTSDLLQLFAVTGSWLLVLRFSESLAWLTRLTADQHLRQGQQLGGRQRAQRQIV